MRSEEYTTAAELNEINKQISKAIRRDIRTYNKYQIEQIIENNKSMNVLRRKLESGKKQMMRIKDKQGSITTNRKYILRVGS